MVHPFWMAPYGPVIIVTGVMGTLRWYWDKAVYSGLPDHNHEFFMKRMKEEKLRSDAYIGDLYDDIPNRGRGYWINTGKVDL